MSDEAHPRLIGFGEELALMVWGDFSQFALISSPFSVLTSRGFRVVVCLAHWIRLWIMDYVLDSWINQNYFSDFHYVL